ncbi:nitrilase-related carbon-nitrogen hydrolase [Paracoccus mutanolyticus]|uniref:nitrilase-related carbon-nitrogen hydrolase n=1 Tax=Paracoccus mutanolyticus TaxID=1499308 RepID=UPI001CB8AFE3|nr:nitrilase-related carbon-nitrogen hydrolase [Paracoccus mutanolyticus]
MREHESILDALRRRAGDELARLSRAIGQRNAGGSTVTRNRRMPERTEPRHDLTLSATDRCRKLVRARVGGIAEREGDRLYNSAVVIGPDGVLGVYRKLHLWADENLWFEAGNLVLPVKK